jgi:hypothetical protein
LDSLCFGGVPEATLVPSTAVFTFASCLIFSCS